MLSKKFLTIRERQIFDLLVKNYDTEEIAEMLEISVEFAGKDGTKSVVKYLRERGYHITEMDKKENEDSILLSLDIDLGKKMSHAKVLDEIGKLEEVEFVMEIF